MAIVAVALSCVIVGITDGDTLTAHCDAKAGQNEQTIRVRLAEIDAPEKAQPFGERSREHLAQLCFRQRAEVAQVPGSAGRDRYGRTVARVSCAGVDVSAEQQVRAGMACVSDPYARDLAFYELQTAARRARSVLWAHPEAVTPWQWRADRRVGHARPVATAPSRRRNRAPLCQFAVWSPA